MGNSHRYKVLIAGGGVAGLEAAFALRELAGSAVQTTLLSPQLDFRYRPLAVREPFDSTPTPSWPLAQLADAAGAELVPDALSWIDPPERIVHTAGARMLRYDALLLALGARLYTQQPYVLTVNPGLLGTQLESLVQQVEHGLVKRVAFLVPTGKSWPMPIYELALLLSARARQVGAAVAITVVTGERAPLAVFGEQASSVVAELLQAHRIRVVCATAGRVRDPHRIALAGSATQLRVDRIIALPELCGPGVGGIPRTARRGFVSIDPYGRVPLLEDVFAAGDMTSNPVKHGGMAAQQADAAAEQIAVLAGARDSAQRCAEVLHGLLLGADHPLYLRAHVVYGVATRSEASEQPLWEPAQKIHARYLGPVLAAGLDPGSAESTLSAAEIN